MKLKLRFLIATVIVLAVYIPAQAQANLTFSGGNGTPLSITLRQSVTYTVNNTQCAPVISSPVFVFDEVGNPFLNNFASFTGTITFSINGGTAQSIIAGNSGFVNGNITANDIYVFGNTPGVPNGSTVVLSAGTITTSGNVASAPPADGSFTTFLTGQASLQCSTNGVAMSPTAATAAVSGYVKSPLGRGISGIQLSLTDSMGNTRTTSTATFGYYRFEDVQVGETYILSASGKRYTFSQSVQVLNVNEETSEVNFIAVSEKRLKRNF
jgi:hypothetical protein